MKLINLIFLLTLLNGCSLPASVSAVSWAMDGASYLTTKKSLTDHGLSFLAGQDCALYRLITGLDVCQHYKEKFFSTIRIVEASDSIERRISQRDVREIFYDYDMSLPDDKIVKSNKEIPVNAGEIKF